MSPESSPPGVVDSSDDGPWHPPSAATAMSRRTSIDSQATATTVVSVSVEPLKMERRRSSNVSFERSAMAFSEILLGLGLSDDEDEEDEDDNNNFVAERSIFLSPTASSSVGTRGRFLGHWRRGHRGTTSSLPSSSSATNSNEARRSSFSRSFRRGATQSDIHDDIRAALQNLDDADIDDDDNEAIARTVERMFGNGDVSSRGGGGGNNGRSSRTIQMEVRNPPARGIAPRRSSLKRPEDRRDWSSRS